MHGQRRVLRDHQAGAQRAAGRRHRVDARRCSASTSRRVLDNALAARRRVGLRRRPRPATRGVAQLPPRLGARTVTTRSGSGAATSTSPTRTPRCGSSSARSSSSTTRRCGRCPSSSPRRSTMDRVVHAPPCIDPLSVKNLDLATPFCHGDRQAVRHRPEPADRVPGEPVRPVEGPGRRDRGVPTSCASRCPTRSSCSPDRWRPTTPRGSACGSRPKQARGGDRDIHLLSNLHQVGDGADQRVPADRRRVVQKSLREGFGLTVSEALWKGRPVVGGRAGGITLQIRDGHDGYLVDSVEECAKRIIDLLADPDGADGHGRGRARARARQLPVDPRARGLAQPVHRAARLGTVTVVVSHRGPYRFVTRPDGGFDVRPGAGGVASALGPLLTSGAAGPGAAWVAAAIERRRPRRATRRGRRHAGDRRSRLLDLDPLEHRLLLRRRVERGAVVPAPRALRPAAPTALRPPLPRGVGRVRRR